MVEEQIDEDFWQDTLFRDSYEYEREMDYLREEEFYRTAGIAKIDYSLTEVLEENKLSL